jgi:hypothetical protein
MLPYRHIVYRTLYALLFTSCLVLSSSCSKDDSPTGVDSTITSDFYVQATIDGSVVTLQHGVGSYGQGVGGSFGGGSDGYPVTVSSYVVRVSYEGGKVVVNPKSSIGIRFTKNFDDYPTSLEYRTVIPLGEVAYGSEEMNIEGVEIIWTDAAGTEWKSRAAEAGNTFVVISHREEEYREGGKLVGLFMTKGEFSCALHDDAGHTMSLTNGTFALRTMPVR